MAVPYLDLAAQTRALREPLLRAVEAVFDRAAFVGGEPVEALEGALAALTGVAHGVGVANGTDALHLLLRALGIGPGDEVIVPALTFFATAEAVVHAGARPLFADVSEDTLLIDPEDALRRVTPRTRAIIAVDLYGRLAPLRELSAGAAAMGLDLVLDAAQSVGVHRQDPGAVQLVRGLTLSFYPTKNLGGAGDGGMILTDEDELAQRLRSLGNHGRRAAYAHAEIGFNSRLDALQAAVLLEKLRYLDVWNRSRDQIARRYLDALGDLEGLDFVVPRGPRSSPTVWHLFNLRVLDGRRDALRRDLAARGIGTTIAYPQPLPFLEAFAGRAERGAYPRAEAAADELLGLPIHPHLSQAQQDEVIEAVRAFFTGRGGSP